MHPLSNFRRNTLTAAVALICAASCQAKAGTTDPATPQTTASAASTAPGAGQDPGKKKNVVNLQQTVVTASPLPSTEMSSSISVSTVDSGQIQSSGVQNAADLLRTVPGIRAESSGGAGNANVSVRGLPVASGGAKYVQFQVDGMPVLEFGDTAFATPDTFLRTDYNIDHVEAVRGGSSSVFASNAPGAIINFITKDGSSQGGDIGLTVGLGSYDQQRLDFDYGGPLSASTRYHFGGFIQRGEGQKSTDYTSSRGGQLMGNITHDIEGGFLRLNLQFTDTYDPVYLPVPVLITGSNSDPHVSSIPGFSLQSGVLQSPYFSSDTALNAQGQTIHTNIRDGYHTRVNAIGGEGKFSLGDDWTLHEQFRAAENYGAFVGPYPASVGGATALAQSIGGTGATLAYASGPQAGQKIGNAGALAGNGLASETHLFNVTLPNMDNFTNNISLSRAFDTSFGKGTLQAGYYHSQQNVVQDWHWNTYLQTVQGKDSVLLDVYDARGQRLTDNGLVAYGEPLWGNCCTRYYNAKFMLDAPFVSMTWETGPWRFDGGLRFDRISASGYYSGASQTSAVDVNRDGALSVPERSVPVYTGATSPIDYTKSHLEYSVGANYTIAPNLAAFLRASSGARFNSDRLLFGGGILADGSVPQPVAVNVVKQYEAGLKWSTAHTSLFVTGFMANTQETNNLVFTGQLSYQPFVNRVYHSRGVELEGSANYGHFSVSGGATYTHSRIVSDQITPGDVGNIPQRQANWVYQFSPSYSWHAFNVGATVMGTSQSYAATPNGLVMPGYTQVNTYVSYDINDRMTASLSVNNLFNAIGLTEIDASPGAVTSSGINTARSILGRTLYLNWQYHL